MGASQPSFTDVEFGQRRRRTQRQEFLARVDQVIPVGRVDRTDRAALCQQETRTQAGAACHDAAHVSAAGVV
ncbi:MAG: hypothetical protein ABI382_02100, partial [Nakamurella sp.]